MMLPVISSEFERMWPCGRSVWHHDLRLARIGDVDGGEILRRALMRQPDDAPAVRRDLDRHAFAHAAEAVERVLGEQLEIPGDRVVGAGLTGLAAYGWLLDEDFAVFGGFNLLSVFFLATDYVAAFKMVRFNKFLPTSGSDCVADV